jgi:RNA polymerase sigma-70 factor, ECF subfamily
MPSLAPVTPLRARPPGGGATDAELVARALAGDRWAQGAIYQRHAPRLLNTCARLLEDRADALDVVQEVFVDALEGLASLREPAALGAWLLRQAVGKVQRRFRRRRWAALLGLRHGPALSLAALAVPGASAEVRAELERLSRVLDRLPPRQRLAWLLHRVEGETLPAVAASTRTSLATVKRDLAAAQAALDAHLAGPRPAPDREEAP